MAVSQLQGARVTDTDCKISSSTSEKHEILCPNIGKIDVYVQGVRKPGEVVVLTVHDLGCDHTMYEDFLEHPRMAGIRDRVVWVHRGQGHLLL